MELTTNNIIYLIADILTVFLIRRFAELFFSKRNCKKHIYVMGYLVCFFVFSYTYVIFDFPIIILTVEWLMTFAISLTYDTTFQKRMTYTTYIIVFMLLPELIIGVIADYFSNFHEREYINGIGLIVGRIVTYCAALSLRKYKASKESPNIEKGLWVSLLLIPVLTLAYGVIFITNERLSTGTIIIASVIFLLVIDIIAFYSLSRHYIQRTKLSVLETENALYCRQCEIMQQSTRELQSFRHDMNNQFIALSQLLISSRYDEAGKLVSDLSAYTKEHTIYSTSENVIIDGIINYKLLNAAKEDIKVKTEIAVPVDLSIDTVDLVTVLGNLIDNALTALKNVPCEQRMLSIKVVFTQQRLIIRISNPFTGNIVYKDGKIVTLKNNQEHHGYGLSNIEKTVKKHKGYMEIDHSDHIFTVDIILYV